MGVVGFFRRLFGGGSASEAECIACGAMDLETLAPDAYRCKACGHEGGDGYPEYMRARARARLGALPSGTLRQQVLAGLEDARLALLALAGDAGEGVEALEGLSFAIEITWIDNPADGLLDEAIERKQQQRMHFDAARHGLSEVRLPLEELVERGEPLWQLVIDLDQLFAHKLGRPADMLRYCEATRTWLEGWTPTT